MEQTQPVINPETNDQATEPQTELLRLEHKDDFSQVIDRLKELRGKYAGLTITEHGQLKNVKGAWQEVRNYRLDLEKQADDIKRRVNQVLKDFTGKSAAYVANLKQLEGELKTEVARVEDEIKAAKEAERLAREQLLRSRETYLYGSGWVFNGAEFYFNPIGALGQMVAGTNDVATGDDEWWAGIVAATELRIEAQRLIDEERAEAERLARERDEAARLAIVENTKAEAIRAAIHYGFTEVAPGDQTEAQIRQQTDAEALDPFGFEADALAAASGDWLDWNEAPALPEIEKPAPHTGVHPSFVLGFEACRANVLAILDSPDKFTREQLKALIRAIEAR